MNQLTLRNRQKHLGVNLRLLRRITRTALEELLRVRRYQLGAYCLGPRAMARLNQEFLQHAGPTDVIAFAYAPNTAALHGEIFLCPAVAVRQAKRFHTSWQSELVRYLVHGLLHLLGHDDKEGGDRRRMKRQEDRILRQLTLRYSLRDLKNTA